MEKRLIDANALLEEIEKVYVDHYEKSVYKFIHDFFNAMRRRIRRAKTVDAVEVVHGRWVMKEAMIKSPFAKNAYCSVCLEETSYAHNFCPNCGAKMDGDQ